MFVKKVHILFSILVAYSYISIAQQPADSRAETLAVQWAGNPAQIEIGGPFVGIEMHNSSPLLNRISFFYPVANSVDASTDYWTRDQSHVLFLGLKIDEKPKEWIGFEPFEYQLTPYSVLFTKHYKKVSIQASYEFCISKPAMVIKYKITNTSAKAISCEFYTHLDLTLKTCHSYKTKNLAWSDYDRSTATLYVNYDDPETANAQLFVTNAGESPQSFASNRNTIDLPKSGNNWWMRCSSLLPRDVIPRTNQAPPITAFVYSKKIAADQSMQIIQIIGACRQGEELVDDVREHYQNQIDAYQQSVLHKAFQQSHFETGDDVLDHSARWAQAILAVNRHYLDGAIVPMPCPAEYNFYFTHDVLLTDLAAVHFDIERVKNDLSFIIEHADSNGIIPHAYYWKDDGYKTEYAGSDNWNHFWFIILSASYFRHSHDMPMLVKLYPYLTTSLEKTLLNMKDDLFWAYRPDWWDIGRSFGPRSYMTILRLRAIRDYIFISAVLNKNPASLIDYEQMATKIEQQLHDKLWDSDLNYLINYYKDGTKDSHYYAGSLLAAHFDVIDSAKKGLLVQTASDKLLDENIGIYNVFPMDFHKLIDYLYLNGNEAGAPFTYINGGVWPHGNAWYAMALMSINDRTTARQFIKSNMTLHGIMNSPNGQPAMYEYRNSNYQNPELYGKVDKPQFLWAAGWYLYCLYNLSGVTQNSWNIIFKPCMDKHQPGVRYPLYLYGQHVTVNMAGAGHWIKTIKYNSEPYPSAVVPRELFKIENIDIILGEPESPYIMEMNSILESCRLSKDRKILQFVISAFRKHRNSMKIVSPWKPLSVQINGLAFQQDWKLDKEGQFYVMNIEHEHQFDADTVEIRFQ